MKQSIPLHIFDWLMKWCVITLFLIRWDIIGYRIDMTWYVKEAGLYITKENLEGGAYKIYFNKNEGNTRSDYVVYSNSVLSECTMSFYVSPTGNEIIIVPYGTRLKLIHQDKFKITGFYTDIDLYRNNDDGVQIHSHLKDRYKLKDEIVEKYMNFGIAEDGTDKLYRELQGKQICRIYYDYHLGESKGVYDKDNIGKNASLEEFDLSDNEWMKDLEPISLNEFYYIDLFDGAHPGIYLNNEYIGDSQLISRSNREWSWKYWVKFFKENF